MISDIYLLPFISFIFCVDKTKERKEKSLVSGIDGFLVRIVFGILSYIYTKICFFFLSL